MYVNNSSVYNVMDNLSYYLGLKNGYGIWRGTEGEYYIGEWKESRTHGKGMYVWTNGDK